MGLCSDKRRVTYLDTKVKLAEEETEFKRAAETTELDESGNGGSPMTKLKEKCRAHDDSDPLQRLVNNLMINMLVISEPDERLSF